MNILELACQFFGWQGGTIHQVKSEFLNSCYSLKCLLVDILRGAELNDPYDHLTWFENNL